MKNILITGKNSYIGKSLKNWLILEPSKYKVNTIDLKDDNWREKNFSQYDVVFHVAGIAHVSTDSDMEELYYKVNRDLTIEVAEKSKNDGVKQFIFMSSIIVYGDGSSSKRVIDTNTIPIPSNFYGKSKLQAEDGIKVLQSNDFKVVILRPPMIYGKNSKGNYKKLSSFIRKTPIFPYYDNQRSMLHIDNLCEFLKMSIDQERKGLYFPQNKEYVRTSDLAKNIAEIHGKKIILTRFFNIFIRLTFSISIINKLFGNLVYEKSMSKYNQMNYQIRDLKESVMLTESKDK